MSTIIDHFTSNSGPDWTALCDRSDTDAPLSEGSHELSFDQPQATLPTAGDPGPATEPAAEDFTAQPCDGPDTIGSLFDASGPTPTR